jgi:hypothetical protein
VAAPMLYARWLRPQLLTWGATPEETSGAYPGDELVPDPDGGATMATTLPAPPERVWPWLVQMGLGRGGWYSWDWLDNDGAPSADRIVTHWQYLEGGQHLDRVPKGPTNRWTVEVLEPDRTLVLQGSYGSLTGQGFDPRSGPRLGHGWKGSGASICGRPVRPGQPSRAAPVARPGHQPRPPAQHGGRGRAGRQFSFRSSAVPIPPARRKPNGPTGRRPIPRNLQVWRSGIGAACSDGVLTAIGAR